MTEPCDAHTRMTAELRALLDLAGERLRPWLDARTTTADPATGPAVTPAACEWCPVCQAIAVLRGDRPEVAARLAEHAAGLLAAARDLLAAPVDTATAPTGTAPTSTGDTADDPSAGPSSDAPPRRRAQRIDVRPASGG